jgi:hypothetical protein
MAAHQSFYNRYMLTRNRHVRSVKAGRHGLRRKPAQTSLCSFGWAMATHQGPARWSPPLGGDAARSRPSAGSRWLAGDPTACATIGLDAPMEGDRRGRDHQHATYRLQIRFDEIAICSSRTLSTDTARVGPTEPAGCPRLIDSSAETSPRRASRRSRCPWRRDSLS